MGKYQQIQLFSPGKRGQFKLVSLDSRPLKSDEVRIKVHFSGLNFADVMMRLGLYPDAPKAPFCPGYEVSGEICEVGTEVIGLSLGDRVLAGLHFGGHSQEVVAPAWQVRKLESEVSLELAASLPVSGLTADFALGEMARVRSQDVVMIDCASGALGAILIGLCKEAGVTQIFGLTSKESKFSEIEKRGARPVLYQGWCAPKYSADVIINSRGGETLLTHRQSLRPLGRMVCLGASHMVGKGSLSYINVIREFLSMKKIGPIDLMNENRGVFGLNVLKLFEKPELLKASLERISKLFEEGKLSPVVDQAFSPHEATVAWDKLAQGKTMGKVLIDWSQL